MGAEALHPLGHFGYDATSLRLWRATPVGASAAGGGCTHLAALWRSQQVTQLLERLRLAMRRHCPQVQLSLAPNPLEFSYRSSLADWAHWIDLGLIDELVVQIYRCHLEALRRELADPGLQRARQRLPLRSGLLAGLKSQPKLPERLRSELALVHRQGISAVDLFFYESVRPHLPLLP